MNWTRQKQYLTGKNGQYKTDHIRGTGDFSNMDVGGNYEMAHAGGMDGSVLLGKPNFINPNNNLHNNIRENVLREQSFDNRIFIDSALRSIEYYPNPFKFDVKFDGILAKTEPVTFYYNGESYQYSHHVEGDTQIVITKGFKNVKYVNMNALIMPIFIDFLTQADGSYKPSLKCLKRFRYLILKIKELKSTKKYSNNQLIDGDGFVLVQDDTFGDSNEYWIPIYNNVSYYDSNLQNINRLSFEIYDNKGNPLVPTLDGKPHDFVTEYKKLIDRLKTINPKDSLIDQLLPKLNSLKCIVENIFPDVHMTFNVLDCMIDTVPNHAFT
jgi:hypothetical protein